MVYLYFEAIVTTSDTLTNNWLAPDGTVVAASNWNSSSGNFCFTGASLSISNLPTRQLGSWQARVYDNGQLFFSVSFSVSAPAVSGPTISAGGVVDGASFKPGPVAPGSIVSIFGTVLASGTAQATTALLPTTLQSTQVLINGIAAPLFYVSPSQINAQVPWEVTGLFTTDLAVQVISNGSPSNVVAAALAITAPGIFVIAHDADNTAVTSAKPAVPGEYLRVYCTGLGTVTNQPSTGAPAPLSPLSYTAQNSTVTIAGLSANVPFSGLSPGFVGLYQVNVQVPANVVGASAAPLVLSNGGNSTTAALVVQSGGVQQFTLTATTAGNGSGSISANPPGPSYPAGTVVTLTATPAAGSTFAGWSGACSGTGSCTVTMNSNEAVTAQFNLTTTGTGSITLSINGTSFGNQALQTMSPAQTILVTSSGTGPLAIASIALSGTNSTDFLQFNNCPGSTGVLSAGAVCFINVMFDPSTTAGESATLTIADNASGSPQTVNLSGQGVAQAVTIGPTATTVEINQSVPFFPNVAGLSNTAVTWSTTAGTISSGGLYTAPASVPSPNTATVTVTSQSNSSLSASATVTIVPTAVSVLVSPSYASLPVGGTEVITAAVADTSVTSVTWSVNGIANGNSAVGTIVTSGTGAQVATYTAPSTLPSTNPVTITATSAADSTKTGTASITIASGSEIVITSLDKTSLPSFNLLTITGSGFNPQASPTINFSDSTGYSVNVSPVSVGANSLVVGVPPYISVSSQDLAAGTVSIQVTQTLGGQTANSNTLTGFQIQNLPTLAAPPGAVTLAMLTAHGQFAQYLINYISQVNPATSFNTPEMNGALNALAPSLNLLISEVSDVVQNPTHSFTLGVASGNTLTVGSTELGRTDRMIVGMLSAQAAAGYGDPQPSCQAQGAGNTAWDVLLHYNGNGPIDAASYNTDLQAAQCFPQAAGTAVTVVGGSAAVAVGGGELLFGAEPLAMASASVSSELTYITSVLGSGMTLVGGALGQGTAYARQMVQGGGKMINDFLKGALESTIVSRTFGESAGRLFDLTVNANELIHAFEGAAPLEGGPSAGPTSTLTVEPGGAGSGTTESYPGGLICGGTAPQTVGQGNNKRRTASASVGPLATGDMCVANYPKGTTVYLQNQSATGSSFSGFGGACSGSACEVTMSSNETVTATFNPVSTGGTCTLAELTAWDNNCLATYNVAVDACTVGTLIQQSDCVNAAIAAWENCLGSCTVGTNSNALAAARFSPMPSMAATFDLTSIAKGQLAGTWSGNITETGGGCSFVGRMSLSLAGTGTALTGTLTYNKRLTSGNTSVCGNSVSATETLRGSVNGNAVRLIGSLGETFSATLNGTTITGTGQYANSTWSYRLTKQ
jgi:uncharacterized protein (TIGR03437 family)